MNPYEKKCGSVRINVQSSAGGGTAWLSANGQKHPYQDFRNKNQIAHQSNYTNPSTI